MTLHVCRRRSQPPRQQRTSGEDAPLRLLTAATLAGGTASGTAAAAAAAVAAASACTAMAGTSWLATGTMALPEPLVYLSHCCTLLLLGR
jgi:hypothetical protein